MKWFCLLAACLAAGCHYPAYAPPARSSGYTPPSATTPPGSGEVVVAGGEGTEVLAEGVAALPAQGGVDIARDQALHDALRKAVEQGVGTLINSETRVENFQLLSDRIYSRSAGYVSSYRVVTEGLEGALYRVVVRARVKLGDIENDLAATGILVLEQGRPRIMVVVKEFDGPADFRVADVTMNQTMLETMLLDNFLQSGFPVVDAATVRQNLEKEQLKRILEGDVQTAVLVGLKAGAEVVIAGTVQLSTARRMVPYTGSAADFYRTKLSTRAINTETAEVMAVSGAVTELPYSEDASQRQAADSASAELIAEILAGWTRHENVTVIQATNASFDKVRLLGSEIQAKLRGIVSVVRRDLAGSTATLEVISETSSQEVLDGLGTRGLEVGFRVKGFSGNRIEIEFTE